MKIAIVGTRGIPNHYGGFEQCAEYLAKGLVEKGFEVIVYNSHNHPYKLDSWNGVKLIHCYDPEYRIGTLGQFIYDFNCILNVRRQNCDIILQLGYTSSSLWGKLLPSKAIVTTNMDGLEWKRTKYSSKVKRFLLYAERLGVKFSDYLISDSIGIQSYLKEKYKKDSVYIPYGANLFATPDPACLADYNLKIGQYDLLIARLEPENSIDTILEGVEMSSTNREFLVIGKQTTSYGKYLTDKFKNNTKIKFIGGLYDINTLNNLRYFSNLYFHGHTVGGTNPSLLEAMASRALICANNNNFNYSILEKDAFYFKNNDEVAEIINSKNKLDFDVFLNNNQEKITSIYTWKKITNEYADHFKQITKHKK